jgi:hypothetical protein
MGRFAICKFANPNCNLQIQIAICKRRYGPIAICKLDLQIVEFANLQKYLNRESIHNFENLQTGTDANAKHVTVVRPNCKLQTEHMRRLQIANGAHAPFANCKR